VKAELERAFGKGKQILPVLIDQVTIPKGWELFLSTSQWGDFTSVKTKVWIESVITKINSLP